MWAALRAEGLDLEPLIPLNECFYFGCSQIEIVPDPLIIIGKRETFNRLCFTGPSGKPDVAGGEQEKRKTKTKPQKQFLLNALAMKRELSPQALNQRFLLTCMK